MKISTDTLGELEVPKIIMDEWERQKADYEDIEEFIREKAYDYLEQYKGKLADKGLAIFLRDYEIGIIPFHGGYCADTGFSFQDSGNKDTVLAFGWNDDCNRPDIHMVGYKETIVGILNKEGGKHG